MKNNLKIIDKIFGGFKNVVYLCCSSLNLMGSDGVGYFNAMKKHSLHLSPL